MRHALLPIAMQLQETYGSRRESERASRARRFQEFPAAIPTTCASWPIMGTAVLTPQSVNRVSRRWKQVMEDVLDKREKKRLCQQDDRKGGEAGDHVGRVELVLIAENGSEKSVLDSCPPTENSEGPPSEKTMENRSSSSALPSTLCSSSHVLQTREVDWGIPVSLRDSIRLPSTSYSSEEGSYDWWLHGNTTQESQGRRNSGPNAGQDRRMRGMGRNSSSVNRASPPLESMAADWFYEEEEEVEEVGLFVVDDALLEEPFFIPPNASQALYMMSNKLPALYVGKWKHGEEQGKAGALDTPAYILLSTMLQVFGMKSEMGLEGEEGARQDEIDLEAPPDGSDDEKRIFPSFPSFRVGELLREVNEGRRPTFALCPSEYVYGSAAYLKKNDTTDAG